MLQIQKPISIQSITKQFCHNLKEYESALMQVKYPFLLSRPCTLLASTGKSLLCAFHLRYNSKTTKLDGTVLHEVFARDGPTENASISQVVRSAVLI